MKKIISLFCLFLVCFSMHNIQANSKVDKPTRRSIAYLITPDHGRDYITNGASTILRDREGVFSLSNIENGIEISFIGLNRLNSWTLSFAAPQGQKLLPGIYKNAERYPFNSTKRPGLDISGSGRGCNKLTGEFEILDIGYDDYGSINSIAVNFVQKCDGGHAMTGTVRYNSAVLIDTRFLEKFLPSRNVDTVAYIIEKDHSSLENSEQLRLLTSKQGVMTINPLPYGGNGFYFLFDSEELGLWSFTFVMPKGISPKEGVYIDAQRYPFNSTAKPGIDLVTNEGPIQIIGGQFTILNLVMNKNEVRSLAINFEMVGKDGKTYEGAIRYLSDIPVNL